MRKTGLVLLLCLLAGLLGGCGRVYQADYYHESDYPLPGEKQESPSQSEKLTVKNYAELRQALLDMVYAGESERSIAFDSDYEGNSRADLEAACGTMHREDALWAYCVQNARYEVSRIVTHDEALLHVEYAASALPVSEVLQLNYAANLEKLLREAMESDARHLVILIGNSRYSADAMADLVSAVYRADPACAAAEPAADVYMYSGAGRQRLYDIELDYGLEDEVLQRRREELAAFDSGALLGDNLSDGMRALALAQFFVENCELSPLSSRGSAWDAMIGRKANPEGLALAYVQLCREQNIPCVIVSGQYQWREHFWNIIELGGQHYHVDLAACIRDGIENGFLLNDESMWAEYRWDTSSYAICAGPLDYWTLTGLQREPFLPPPVETQAPPPESEAPAITTQPEETPKPEASPEPEESTKPEASAEPEISPAPEETETPEVSEEPEETPEA